MDGSEQLFKWHLKDSIADREGKVNVDMVTFAGLVRHVRGNEDFEPRDYVIINQQQKRAEMPVNLKK